MNKKDKGYTLVEILFALSIGIFLLGVIYSVVISGQKSSAALERKVSAMQDVRSVLEVMALEIGMASYNPNYAEGVWVNTSCGNNPPAYQPSKGIQEATPMAITIEMDINDSSIVGDGGNEVIRYAYSAANQFITRSSNCQPAEAILGEDPTTGRARTVRVINPDLGINNGRGAPAVFRFYDGGNPVSELYPDITPNDIPNVRRIDITLAVETNEVSPDTGQRRRMIYSTSVIPRNHAIGR